MRTTKNKIRQIIRRSLGEAYEKTEYVQDRPDYERLEKLRKAGRFERSNISKADEEEAAAHIKFMRDLEKENERKVAEIERMKQKRKARRGERSRIEENQTWSKTMKLTKGQLKKIIREEYTALKQKRLIKEALDGKALLGELMTLVGEVDDFDGADVAYELIDGADPSFEDFCMNWDGSYEGLLDCVNSWAMSIPPQFLRNDVKRVLNALEAHLGLNMTM